MASTRFENPKTNYTVKETPVTVKDRPVTIHRLHVVQPEWPGLDFYPFRALPPLPSETYPASPNNAYVVVQPLGSLPQELYFLDKRYKVPNLTRIKIFNAENAARFLKSAPTDSKHERCIKAAPLTSLQADSLYIAANISYVKYSFGEACIPKPVSLHTEPALPLDVGVSRIIDTVRMLASIANLAHRRENFERNTKNELVMKFAALDTVFSEGTHEFNFFTQYRPLFPKEFLEIIEAVKAIAKQCHPNLHLLFSSFAAMADTADTHVNLLIDVDCGPDSWVRVIVKAYPMDSDYTYDGRNKPTDLIPSWLQDTGLVSGPVIIAATAGGTRYFRVIDICRDHAEGYGKEKLKEVIRARMHAGKLSPLQVEHIVTSNYVILMPQFACSGLISHIDPVQSGLVRTGTLTVDHAFPPAIEMKG